MSPESPSTDPTTPLGVLDPDEVNSILDSLKGFGICDNDQLITMTVNGRTVNLRVSNLSPEDEIKSLLTNVEIKGHAWVQQMRCDLLSRAITWINGVHVTDDTFAKDPYLLEDRPIRAILRDMFMRWGGQPVLIFWKIYMVHCQSIENNLMAQLPDAAIFTNAEARFMEQVADELKAVGVAAMSETADLAAASLDDETT